ncbi:TMEM175 family protein [Caulobacter sp. CCNWLY153]|jgi:uncharacterized membrane protein|uniref:TMEM175 family protein n=1 Tax=Caulobacter TaxID=75 RepID=UPI001A9C4E07|nr:TMEM175 family protein [Caulobacter radicis]
MATQISKTRLEAFSDGVIAIIITIMVLELQPPKGGDLAALLPLLPTFLGYALSFTYVGIYWNNHHHLLRAAGGISGSVMWANLHLLFWLSMIPFATAWMEQSHFARVPVVTYGVLLLITGAAFRLLASRLARHEGRESALAAALGGDWKTNLSIAGYAAGVLVAIVSPTASLALYVAVAALWLLPDRRVAHLADGRHHAAEN